MMYQIVLQQVNSWTKFNIEYSLKQWVVAIAEASKHRVTGLICYAYDDDRWLKMQCKYLWSALYIYLQFINTSYTHLTLIQKSKQTLSFKWRGLK